MNINNFKEFNVLLYELAIHENEYPSIKNLRDCINFYGGMCGCQEVAKEEKAKECEELYRNFIMLELNTIKDILFNSTESIYNFYSNSDLLITLTKE